MMDFLKRLWPEKPAPDPHEGKLIISPSLTSIYVDTDGKLCEVHSDTIAKRDYLWVRDSYSVIVPGLKEWCERYRRALDPEALTVGAGFDWKDWHHDGLLFARELLRKLPREVTLRYARPQGDVSGLVEDFDVTQEAVEQILTQIGTVPNDREPVIEDNVVVGVKSEDGYLCVRLKTKGTYDTFTFSLEPDSLYLLKGFLERIIMCDGKPVEWESNHEQNGMYFFPQTIGNVRHMGQLQIYTEGKSEPDYTAYVNARHLIRSIYRSIMSNASSFMDDNAYKGLQSNVIEWYIDDRLYESAAFLRRNPKLTRWLSPALLQVKDFFADIYDSIYEDNAI